MIESMRPGSIIVDLAAERGGNAELTKPGEIIEHNGVRIFGKLNLAGSVPVNASSLYARNLQAFIEPLIDKEKKTLLINFDDELVKGTLIAKDGAIVNAMIAERLGGKSGGGDPAPAKPANSNGNGQANGKKAAPKRKPKGSKTGGTT
jgi:NAD(P) transhydrogenase subunit alpha